MSASLSDILTAAKNIVTAINGLAQSYNEVQGSISVPAVSALTQISQKGGRVASISVTTAGTSTGLVYDSNAATVTTRPVYVIPEAVGVYVVNLPVSYGVLVQPGTGQVLTVSYS